MELNNNDYQVKEIFFLLTFLKSKYGTDGEFGKFIFPMDVFVNTDVLLKTFIEFIKHLEDRNVLENDLPMLNKINSTKEIAVKILADINKK